MSNTTAANIRPITLYDVNIQDNQEVSLETIFGPLKASQKSSQREHLREAVREIAQQRVSTAPMMAWTQVRENVYELRLQGQHLNADLRAAGASQATIELNLAGDRPRLRPSVSYTTRTANTSENALAGLRSTTMLAFNTVFAYAVHRQVHQRLTVAQQNRQAIVQPREHVTLRDNSVRFRNLAQLRVGSGQSQPQRHS